jgi:putative tricarboxylic transport membrane protein
MPPDFFPRCITVMLGILSSMLLIQRLKRTPSEKGNDIDKMDANQSGFLQHATAIFLFFLYVLSIYLIGWIIATVIAVPGLMVYFGARRWSIIIILAVLVPIVLYLFFEKTVQVPLPAGMFFK